MKADLYNQKAKKQTTGINVSDEVFGGQVNTKLLAQYVHVYLSNQRESVAHAKNRAEVSGGGRKPFAQKGTGNARAGSNRSPLWKGGGVTFGPRNERNWKKNFNKKMRAAAMRSALAQLLNQGALKFVDEIKFEANRLTSQAAEVLGSFENPKKVTIITNGVRQDLVNAFANIKKAKVKQVQEVSAYDLLTAGQVLMLADAAEYTQVWSGQGSELEGEQRATSNVEESEAETIAKPKKTVSKPKVAKK